MEPMIQKWQSFNFEVAVATDGNDEKSIGEAFDSLDMSNEMPKIIIAHTVKGFGISYMENKMEWHYLPMTDEQYRMAMDEISG